jgi:putative PIN family toxin of toxin-antitoxin system
MLKAVVDTNVLISGTIRKSGHPNRIMSAWREGLFVLVTSESLIEEAGRVFRYPRISQKYGLTEGQINRVLKSLERYALVTPGKLKINVIKEDPDDNQVIVAAVEAEADCMVSGDPHLLNLGSYRGIEIVSPGQFVKMLRRQ